MKTNRDPKPTCRQRLTKTSTIRGGNFRSRPALLKTISPCMSTLQLTHGRIRRLSMPRNKTSSYPAPRHQARELHRCPWCIAEHAADATS
ncbi:hypothetical protein E2C01_090815 [Portunus trituberculatus]|uniref:Uncharacterized protein n=1 Tax=Portunus trituberculatus TaxID=210409 RepID=A0A5B7JR56_PORTR|nr:hypothetical protein [Portunus trituberculatus]